MKKDMFTGARKAKARYIVLFKYDIKRYGEKRVNAMYNGTIEDVRKYWELEKKAVIQLARIQNRKLREGFAES